jgi:DNA-binding CsgD family transcriptional regulator
VEDILMARKPTYEELGQRLQELEEEASKRKLAEEAMHESTRRLELAYAQSIIYARELNEKIAEHKKAEEALQKAHDALEVRVDERTAELGRTTEQLKVELTEHKRTERVLRQRETALETRTNELEELNKALRVLLKQRDKDRTELEENVMLNVKELVLPYTEKLKARRLDAKSMAYLSVLERNLNDIISPFAHTLSSKHLSLTPAEIQIANLVKDGRTSKEMAELLNVSRRTIESHRQNIRMKVGLHGERANLRSHLLSI